MEWWKKVIIASIVMVLLSPVFAYACELTGYMEPLEVSAEKLGVKELSLYEAPMPDYVIPVIQNTTLSGILAGLVGVAIVLGFSFGLSKALKTQRKGESRN